MREVGNIVIVVENDVETMENADYIIDLGLEAGLKGGNITDEGKLKKNIETKESITGN
jgi:Excinuclease ATPase subunit